MFVCSYGMAVSRMEANKSINECVAITEYKDESIRLVVCEKTTLILSTCPDFCALRQSMLLYEKSHSLNMRLIELWLATPPMKHMLNITNFEKWPCILHFSNSASSIGKSG